MHKEITNPYQYGTQKWKVMDSLLRGPVRNYEIVNMRVLKYTNRLSEIRQDGFDIQAKDIGNGVWEYKLIREQGELF